MQEQMLGGKGFLVIGYLLEKSSRVHVTRAVLEQFLSFAKYLDGLTHGAPLLKQLCDHVLFNAAIWIHTPAKVGTERESVCVCLCLLINCTVWIHTPPPI
eukprot:XP_014053827.1 PREDICTED: putative protein BCL8 [Salmo salar]